MNKQMLVTMLTMQDALNKVVDVDWLVRGRAWHRAVLVETVEAIDHYGWKWWKKQTPDLNQVKMEMVDIWHFLMSWELVNFKGDYALAADEILDALNVSPDKGSTLEKLDQLAASAGNELIDYCCFNSILMDIGMEWKDVYQTYVAKNVLNRFRQEHGYKEGVYIKVWRGEEDNIHLSRLMEAHPDNPEWLYESLEETYKQITKELK